MSATCCWPSAAGGRRWWGDSTQGVSAWQASLAVGMASLEMPLGKALLLAAQSSEILKLQGMRKLQAAGQNPGSSQVAASGSCWEAVGTCCLADHPAAGMADLQVGTTAKATLCSD